MEQVPEGKVRIRKLDRNLGDVTEVVDIKDAKIKIEDTELIIDEDTNEIIDRNELDGKLEAGTVKRIRTTPPISGGC